MLPKLHIPGINVKVNDSPGHQVVPLAFLRFLTRKYETKPAATTPAIIPLISHQFDSGVGVGIGTGVGAGAGAGTGTGFGVGTGVGAGDGAMEHEKENSKSTISR